MNDIPISEKYTLTMKEAAVYFNIDVKKLRRLSEGYLYKKTNTLLVPIIYHYILDALCEIPQVFSGADWTEYSSVYLMISLMIGAAVSIYSAIGANELDKEISNAEQIISVD